MVTGFSLATAAIGGFSFAEPAVTRFGFAEPTVTGFSFVEPTTVGLRFAWLMVARFSLIALWSGVIICIFSPEGF
jgi:hypothetical protein